MNVEVENELVVIAGCLIKDFYKTIKDKINHEFFRNFHTQEIFIFIKEYYEKYGHVPTRKIILSFCKSDERFSKERTEISKLIFLKVAELDEKEIFYFIDQCVSVAKNCHQAEFIDSALGYLEKCDYVEFDRVVDEYIKNRGNIITDINNIEILDHGSTFEERFDSLIEDEETQRKYFKIHFKDDKNDFSKILGRSISPDNGTLISIIGKTGIGKSTLLMNIVKMCVVQEFRILDIILEGTYEYIQCQYDAIFSGVPTKQIFDGKLTEEQYERIIESMERVKGYLHHCKKPMKTITIQNVAEIADSVEQRIGHKIDGIFVKPGYHTKSPYSDNETDKGKTLHKIYLYEGYKRLCEISKRFIFFEDQVQTEFADARHLSSNMTMYCRSASIDLDIQFGIASTLMEQARKFCHLQLLKSRMSDNKRYEVKLRGPNSKARFLNGW